MLQLSFGIGIGSFTIQNYTDETANNKVEEAVEERDLVLELSQNEYAGRVKPEQPTYFT